MTWLPHVTYVKTVTQPTWHLVKTIFQLIIKDDDNYYRTSWYMSPFLYAWHMWHVSVIIYQRHISFLFDLLCQWHFELLIFNMLPSYPASIILNNIVCDICDMHICCQWQVWYNDISDIYWHLCHQQWLVYIIDNYIIINITSLLTIITLFSWLVMTMLFIQQADLSTSTDTAMLGTKNRSQFAQINEFIHFITQSAKRRTTSLVHNDWGDRWQHRAILVHAHRRT